MTSQEIVIACNKMIAEHREAALAFTQAKADSAANSIEKAKSILMEAFGVKNAVSADASPEIKSQAQASLTKAGEGFTKAQENAATYQKN